MGKTMDDKVIKKESVIKAAQFFLTSNQNEKNRIIDRMFIEQPSLIEFLDYLDKAINKELTKEVIIQLMAIFYFSISLQKIKLGKIPFSDFMNSRTQSIEMTKFFHNPNYNFDGESFKTFFDGYVQKEILNYTYFAINNQFRIYIETENDSLFIFYILKIFGDVIDQNIE
jgi:hypothetical protein